MNALKFVIVDDNLVFGDAFRSILENELSAEVIDTFASDEDLLFHENALEADIIFINLIVAGRNGFETIKRFLWDYPYLNVVGINSYYAEHVYLLKLIEVGFKGCIDGNNISNEINDAVSMVMQGQLYFTKRIKSNVCAEKNKFYY